VRSTYANKKKNKKKIINMGCPNLPFMVEINRGHVFLALGIWIMVVAGVLFTTEELGQDRMYYAAIGLIVGLIFMAFGTRYLMQKLE